MNLLKGIGKLPSVGKYQDYEKKTPYFKDGSFTNVENYPLMRNAKSPKSKMRIPEFELPICDIKEVKKGNAGELSFYWLGHSSILLQLGSQNILIDPVLTKYASPFSFMGVKRYSRVPISPDGLPDIDLLLLSHDHYDHLDYQTLVAIKDKVKRIAVPLGVDSIFKSFDIKEELITALAWNEEITFDGISITATPAKHFSTRNPLHPNATWWCGFVISDGNHHVYYSGDGGYSKSFKEIGEKFEIDLAFMECGQYDLRWPDCHMFPEETVQAALDVGAKHFVPIHWGAFCLCNSAWNDSPIRTKAKARELSLSMITPRIGERVEYQNIASFKNEWWNE